MIIHSGLLDFTRTVSGGFMGHVAEEETTQTVKKKKELNYLKYCLNWDQCQLQPRQILTSNNDKTVKNILSREKKKKNSLVGEKQQTQNIPSADNVNLPLSRELAVIL